MLATWLDEPLPDTTAGAVLDAVELPAGEDEAETVAVAEPELDDADVVELPAPGVVVTGSSAVNPAASG